MKVRTLGLLLVMLLTTAACGARLTDEQRAAGIGAVSAGGQTQDTTGPSGQTSSALPGARTSGTAAVTGATTRGSNSGSSGGTASQAAAANVDNSSSGGQPAAASNQSASCKGGASDVGVTSDSITIATVADVTGPSPGLFKSAGQAVQAYANMVNSQGGVCGRQIKVMNLDSKTDSGGNRSAVLEACKKSFALVGNMSAFDQGGASAVKECKIPDLNAIVTSTERLNGPYSYAVFPSRQDLLAVGQSEYTKQQHPDAIKKAAILWLNAAATRNNAMARQKAWEKVGFNFVYTQEVQVLEANYTQYVLQMEQQGVQYVTMVGDNSSIARLMKAAKQQGWSPEVWDWDSVAYDPGFITQTGDASEGAHVFVNTAMLEEANVVPEMAKYETWMQKSFPGAEPDYFGIYAWSAAELFVKKLEAMGASPKRDTFLQMLGDTHSYDGNGLHGPQDVGAKKPTTCFLYMKIQGGKFVREYPSQPGTWDCKLGGYVQV